MDYEKAYKDALEKARAFELIEHMNIMASIFPELKESEDEKAKKIILALPFKHEADYKFVKTWLEKQGNCSAKWEKNTPDNKPALNHSVLMKNIHGIAEGEWNGKDWFQYTWSSNIKDSDVLNWMELYELEKLGEEKPFDYESTNIQQKDFASVGETATIELSSPIDCGDRIYHVSHKPIEKQGEQKPAAWSDEDEHRIEDTIYFLDTAKKHYASTILLDACIDWLKSLKQRIGG